MRLHCNWTKYSVKKTLFHGTEIFSFVCGENPANYKPPQQIAIITLFNHQHTQLNVVTNISTFGCTPRQTHHTLHYSSSHCKYTDVNKALLSISFEPHNWKEVTCAVVEVLPNTVKEPTLMYEVNLYGESLASYPGSSPRFLHGEEPGYEASESLQILFFMIHLVTWCTHAATYNNSLWWN